MIRGLIRFLGPLLGVTAAAGQLARALYGNTSAQAALLVFVGAVVGSILGGIWVIKYIERLAETQRSGGERR